jgi:rubrerythrin
LGLGVGGVLFQCFNDRTEQQGGLLLVTRSAKVGNDLGVKRTRLLENGTTMNEPYVIDSRDELILALQEAAHIEHGLLLQYLYAAFSIKQSEAEDLAWDEVELVRGWKADLLRIARDEMGHLGTVMNMTMAVGGTPSFQRPPFPRPSLKWFPVPFELTGFSPETIERFIRFESPQPVTDPSVERALIAPELPTYAFIGEFYRSIKEGFANVAKTNSNLFLGRPGAQDQNTWRLSFPPAPITSVADAQAAIDALVAQGEGTPNSDDPDAHFTTFTRIALEHAQAVETRPTFVAGRNVVTNPMLRPLSDPAPGVTVIEAGQPCFEAIAIHSSLYILLLHVLQIYYDPVPQEQPVRDQLQKMSSQLMMAVIRPLGELITTLPVGVTGTYAGASFELYGDITLPTDANSRWTLMNERVTTNIAAIETIGETSVDLAPLTASMLPALHAISKQLQTLSKQLQEREGERHDD